jgi:hypothetical protein
VDEGGPGGVRGEGAHRRDEGRGGGRVVAHDLELGGVAVHGEVAGTVRVRPALGQLLVEVRELRDPGDRLPALRDGGVPRLPALVADPVPEGAAPERGGTPLGLDPLELRPPGGGQVVGEPLDREGAACGVGHPRDVRLVNQQRRGVARDPAAEPVRQPDR